MQCRNICEMLSPYIDDMLESSQVVEVEEHIAVCAACRLEYDKLRAAVELVRGLPEVLPPSEFHEDLLQKLQSLPAHSVTDSPTVWIRRLAWGKWSKTLAVAVVLFLTIGVTAFWYGNKEGGLPGSAFQLSVGQNIDDRGERYGGDAGDDGRDLETAQKTAKNAQEQTAKDTKATEQVETEKNAARDQDTGQGNLAAPGVSVSNKQLAVSRETGEEPVTAAGDDNPGSTAAGGDQVSRDLVALEGKPVGDDSLFSMMAAPRDDLGDVAIMENNSLPAATELTATLTLNTQPNAVTDWSATAGRYGGFVETEPQQTGEYWVLRVPTGNVDGFIKELNNLGQVDIQSNTRDIAVDLKRAEERLNMLQEQEKALVAQGAGQTESDAVGTAELDALREQITLQQRALEESQKDVNFAKINLYVK